MRTGWGGSITGEAGNTIRANGVSLLLIAAGLLLLVAPFVVFAQSGSSQRETLRRELEALERQAAEYKAELKLDLTPAKIASRLFPIHDVMVDELERRLK